MLVRGSEVADFHVNRIVHELTRKLIASAEREPKQAEAIFVFVDEPADNINDAFFVVEGKNTGDILGVGPVDPYCIVDYPASYHDGAAVISFADGHVEVHRWLESTTTPPEGMAGPRVHTSATDREMAWLQQRATEER